MKIVWNIVHEIKGAKSIVLILVKSHELREVCCLLVKLRKMMLDTHCEWRGLADMSAFITTDYEYPGLIATE